MVTMLNCVLKRDVTPHLSRDSPKVHSEFREKHVIRIIESLVNYQERSALFLPRLPPTRHKGKMTVNGIGPRTRAVSREHGKKDFPVHFRIHRFRNNERAHGYISIAISQRCKWCVRDVISRWIYTLTIRKMRSAFQRKCIIPEKQFSTERSVKLNIQRH